MFHLSPPSRAIGIGICLTFVKFFFYPEGGTFVGKVNVFKSEDIHIIYYLIIPINPVQTTGDRGTGGVRAECSRRLNVLNVRSIVPFSDIFLGTFYNNTFLFT